MDSIKYIEYINTLQNKHLHNHDLIVFVSNGPELKLLCSANAALVVDAEVLNG